MPTTRGSDAFSGDPKTSKKPRHTDGKQMMQIVWDADHATSRWKLSSANVLRLSLLKYDILIEVD